MSFCQALNALIQKVQCSSQELAKASGLSAATISRYRSGERVPAGKSEVVQKLSAALADIAAQKGLNGLTESAIAKVFAKAGYTESAALVNLVKNFDALVSALKINLNDLAKNMNFDASYLSRIRNGQRQPADPYAFAQNVCGYVVRHCANNAERIALTRLIGCDAAIETNELANRLQSWLWMRNESHNAPLVKFLKKLDSFDLNTFIRAMHFDQIKVPSTPFHLPASKYYYGVPGFRQAELTFLKSTAVSNSKDRVFMCSDMPMSDMAEDVDFAKKWMMGLAIILKKGLHLDVIHNIDRPFEEMMLGLESWIPLYMTGQISPYYLKGSHNSVYCHLNYASGAAVLEGQCIANSYTQGRYYFSNGKEDIAYYQGKASNLLKKACPLMEIFTEAKAPAYRAFVATKVTGDCRSLLSTLPIYTLSEETLRTILKKNHLSPQAVDRILSYAVVMREAVERHLAEHWLCDQIPYLSKEEFSAYPMSLSLSGLFFDHDVLYDYDSYCIHLQETEAFSKRHDRYTLQPAATHSFRNIQILIQEGNWVLVSKNTSPAIHFVIRHPKLCHAIENISLPVADASLPDT